MTRSATRLYSSWECVIFILQAVCFTSAEFSFYNMIKNKHLFSSCFFKILLAWKPRWLSIGEDWLSESLSSFFILKETPKEIPKNEDYWVAMVTLAKTSIHLMLSFRGSFLQGWGVPLLMASCLAVPHSLLVFAPKGWWVNSQVKLSFWFSINVLWGMKCWIVLETYPKAFTNRRMCNLNGHDSVLKIFKVA